jgi:hypothetical protein
VGLLFLLLGLGTVQEPATRSLIDKLRSENAVEREEDPRKLKALGRAGLGRGAGRAMTGSKIQQLPLSQLQVPLIARNYFR